MLKKLMDSYKLLIIIPVIITIISLGLIAFNGIDEGIDLKGGSVAVLDMNQPTNSSSLENQLKDSLNNQGLGVEEVDVLSNIGTDITVQIGSEVNSTAFSQALNGTGTVVSYNAIGPILSEEAMTQVYWAMAFAFLFMSITVFIIFREPVPSVAVILAAASDIIISMGGMSLFNIPLSIASVGALLMLIGYSVDTDILLTTRLLKRKEGTLVERAREAMKTGMTMSITAIASMVVLYLVTIFLIPEATTLTNIAAVLMIGLVADILTTWFMNLGILRWYVEAKK
ncbi:preprotein translocase subunit SecF [Methanobrevibacter arboriphilus]|jgi:preprotein translocase subunit SecF|uniref:Preprotein translocase subunit SecF n=1 Tax=Methanobrevibacter arboriphilus TaxID=39441 RepID=A0ACA8R5K8_METAZ|nr:protein translocase subunit SecF [Methanobrevibacter arboriphilus]BBL62818.1 preprotein translocase subunit SecF [Methanobrevibacter arboriphilus]GLI12060.1 preprotein translocase subunit SecF [Methanobrevibacter arboriphilus]